MGNVIMHTKLQSRIPKEGKHFIDIGVYFRLKLNLVGEVENLVWRFRIWFGRFRIWCGKFSIWSGRFRIWSGRFRIWCGRFRILVWEI